MPLTNPIGGGLPMAVIGAPTASTPASLEAPERYTQIVALWQSDCLVCGLSPFDSDTLILLGYPVEEEEEEEGNGEEDGGEGDRVKVWGGARGLFQPEVQLVKRHNGEVRQKEILNWRGGVLFGVFFWDFGAGGPCGRRPHDTQTAMATGGSSNVEELVLRGRREGTMTSRRWEIGDRAHGEMITCRVRSLLFHQIPTNQAPRPVGSTPANTMTGQTWPHNPRCPSSLSLPTFPARRVVVCFFLAATPPIIGSGYFGGHGPVARLGVCRGRTAAPAFNLLVYVILQAG